MNGKQKHDKCLLLWWWTVVVSTTPWLVCSSSCLGLKEKKSDLEAACSQTESCCVWHDDTLVSCSCDVVTKDSDVALALW